MRISLILTVLNEAEHIPRLFDSVVAQTRQPDEVVVCDGGSGDGTLALIREYANRLPLVIIEAHGTNIAAGRNAAIRAASGEVIAVTDAGVRLAGDWLAALVAPFEAAEESDRPAWAAGFFVVEAHTAFEIALGATVLPALSEIDPDRFLPSSRSVAFRRAAWAGVGGYPEWLDFSEDVVFDLRLREQFGPFAFAPQAIVHFRPRTSLVAFARQYFNYAVGDGRAGLFPQIHFVRYFTYLLAVPLGLYGALAVNSWLWLAGVLAGLAYVRRPILRVRRSWRSLSFVARLKVLALIPVIRVVGDLAKLLGYPVGVWRRISAERAS